MHRNRKLLSATVVATVLGFMTGWIASAQAAPTQELARFVQHYSSAMRAGDTAKMRELARRLDPGELYQVTDTLVEEIMYARCKGEDDVFLHPIVRSLANQFATLYQKRAMTIHVETMLSLDRRKCADYLKARDLFRAGGKAYEAMKYPDAESIYQQALTIAQRLANTELQLHTLNELSNVEAARGNVKAAIDYLTKSLALTNDVADPQAAIAVSCNAGQYFARAHDYTRAAQHYERCIGSIENHPLQKELLWIPYKGIIEAYSALGRHGEARDIWARLLRLREGKDERWFFDNAVRLAPTVGQHGDTELAMEIIDALRSTTDSTRLSKKERVVVLVALAGAYQSLEAAQFAKQYSELALSLAKDLDDNHLFAMASLVLAYANISLGQPDEALLYVKESYRRNANAPASYITIDTIRLLAALHEQMGQLDQWRRYIEEAYDRATRANLVPESAKIALEIASLSVDMGHFKQADDFVDRALATGSAAGIYQARAHAIRARIRQQEGKLEEAVLEYSHALRLQQQASLAHDKVVTSLNMAAVYLDLRDTVRARSVISNFDRRLLLRGGEDLSRTLQTLGARIKYLEGAVEEAIADFSTVYEYQKALAYRERYSLSERPSRSQLEFRANGQAYADMLMAAAESRKDGSYAQRALFVSDHGKSINFQKLISRHLASTVRNLDSDTRAAVEKLNALLIQKENVEKKVREYEGANNPKHDKQLIEIDRELIGLSKTLGEKLPTFQKPFIELTKLEQIQRWLEIDEAIVSYSVRYARSTAFVVTRSKLAYEPISISRKELRDNVEGVLRGVRNVTELEDLRRFSPMSSYELYRLLFHPLQPHLKGIKKITIVADDTLYAFPFEMLVVSPPQPAAARKGVINPYLSELSNTKYLVDQYTLTYLPSVSSFVATREHRQSALWLKTLVAFGDPQFDQLNDTLRTVRIEVETVKPSATSKPTFKAYRKRDKDLAFGRLKHSGKEVEAMAEITSARPSDIYVRERASEANVYRAQLKDARYILFATHAVMPSEENGMQEAALALAPTTIGGYGLPDADKDGLLTVSEVMGLRLSAELVVLSACNTAGSTMHGAGEGFVGLTRAFMFAGAKNLLVSHWPVESDSTRRLMVEVLRRNVKEGQRGDQALNEAKKWLRTLVVEHPEHASGKMSLSHPFFWASFVWVGGY